MLARLRHPDLRPVVAALFAVAMIWLGFGHRPVVLGEASGPPGFAQLVLPDGSPAEFCAPASDAAPRGKPHAGAHLCDACVLAVRPVPAAVMARAAPAMPGAAPVTIASAEVRPRDQLGRPQSRAPPPAA
ncbi:hypothetical protein [Phreatobacter stygius]|uniref:DUF2946 domain-containing protein n=1 Tax=Phreatobacter stygius TaxID=1940610 RepID=A0A4D7BC81_9HYPH|nr:hypothetical protein [Phreatobacter stygius]QCI66996.1 hypothetical protein E8M01_23770 [Phreatobacter stygius]